MKNAIKITMWVLSLGLVLGSCEENYNITPSGYITVIEKDVTDFDGLEVSTAFEVYITFTTGEDRVEIEADDNLQPLILVSKSGSHLWVRLKNGTGISGNPTLKVHIYTSEPMNYISATGACTVTLLNTLVNDNLHIELEGASLFEGQLDVSDLVARVSGASIMSLGGTADKFFGNVEGATFVNGFELECGDLDLVLEGASNVKLTVNGTMDLDASGSSTLVYKGNPVIGSIRLSGSSHLINGN